MKEEEKRKFSIVAYLPSPVFEKVRSLQEEMSEISGSRACLDEWEPHITVGSGPKVDEDELAMLEHQLEMITKNQKPITVQLKGFGSFYKEHPDDTGKRSAYAIWIECIVSAELQAFAEYLKNSTTDKYDKWYNQPWPYHPHATLAFKDLQKEGFQKGLELLKDKIFDETFVIDNISLVLKEETKDIEFKKFNFLGK